MRFSVLLFATLVTVAAGCAQTEPGRERKQSPSSNSTTEQGSGAKEYVVMDTSMGKITLELWPEQSPITVKNFLQYVDDKFYDGTIFHRIVPTFMIQGGGMTPGGGEKPTRPPIKNEAGNGLSNKRGTIAMARTGVPDSATSQFFINVENNDGLDRKNEGVGYAVFGRVIEGMDVVDKIKRVPTGGPPPERSVPLETVTILSIRRAPVPAAEAKSEDKKSDEKKSEEKKPEEKK